MRPNRVSAELAVVRAKALNRAARIGMLFVHPGTHDAGVDFVLEGVGAPAFERVRSASTSSTSTHAARGAPVRSPAENYALFASTAGDTLLGDGFTVRFCNAYVTCRG